MHRLPLTELAVHVTLDRTTPDVCHVRWTVRESPVYPSPPGADPMPVELVRAETRLDLSAAERAVLRGASDVGLLADRLFVADAVRFVDHASTALRNGRWARVALSVGPAPANDALDELPWEAVFAAHGLVTVRREQSPDSFLWRTGTRPRLAFPLTLWALGVDCDLARDDLLDGYAIEAVELGALAWTAVACQAPDIIHIACARTAASLPALAHRLARGPDRSPPRLVVLHDASATRASSSLAAELHKLTGADAVLYVAGGGRDAFRIWYRRLLHDWPLDRCLGELHDTHLLKPAAGLLRCMPGGETCVALSAVIGAPLLQGGRATFRGLPEHARSRAHHRLRDAWRDALLRPLDQIVARAGSWTARQDSSDLIQAIVLARDVDVISGERSAVAKTIGELERARPAEIADASARVTEVRISDPSSAADVAVDRSLVIEQPYRLHVQIVRKARASAWAQAAFPEAALRETLARQSSVELSVAIHPLVGEVRLSSATGTLRLPALGDSEVLAADLVVASAGAFSLRVCIYYGTALLQALVVEGTAGRHAAEPGMVRSTLDFAASADFMALDQHEQPDVTIWTNQAADGTHWFGVFTRADQHCVGLTHGGLVSLTSDALQLVADDLRRALTSVLMRPTAANQDPGQARAKGHAYRFDPPAPADNAQREDRLQQLVSLAQAGWRAYNGLFPDRTPTHSPAASPVEGLLAIARCRPERANIAWAALYDYHLSDPDPRACDVFAEQLRTGQDLLDRPHDCRARPDCPLGHEERRDRTVCPFGFWGLRHRIEQPPHHMAPPAEGGIKDDMELERASALNTAIMRPAGNPAHLGIAWWPHFDERVERHLEMLGTLGVAERESDRGRILALLARGQKQIYYFFCHGEGENLTFELIVGPGEHDAITVGDLNDDRYTWSSDGPAPVVFLNGCDTTAFRGDTINNLLSRFRAMGASGVIGTEIPVHTYLAEDVGKRVLAALVAGQPLGDAFLALRRDLLRTQINPLGLAYSFFGSARLHLCEGGVCRVCKP